MVAARLDGAEDYVIAQVGVALVQAHLEIRRLIVVGEIHRAPFNVKDAIGRAAGDGGKNATAAGEVRTTLAHDVGAIIAPETEYRVIKWPNIRRRRQAHTGKAAGLVDRNEVKAAI